MTELDENRNVNIQKMFQSNDPEEITEIYNTEMNKAVNKFLIVKKVQKTKFEAKFMNKKLVADKKRINFWNKKFTSSRTHEDYRVLKNLKNRYTKDIKRAKKNYYKLRYATNLGKWKTLREEENFEEKGLNTAIVDGKIINSQEKLANKFSESFLNKICNIKKEMPANNILAENFLKNWYPG